jgi:hypothetical protein
MQEIARVVKLKKTNKNETLLLEIRYVADKVAAYQNILVNYLLYCQSEVTIRLKMGIGIENKKLIRLFIF